MIDLRSDICVRFVTHRLIGDEDIRRAGEVVRSLTRHAGELATATRSAAENASGSFSEPVSPERRTAGEAVGTTTAVSPVMAIPSPVAVSPGCGPPG